MVQTIELIVAKVGAKEFRLFFTRVSPFVFPNLIKPLGWVGGLPHLGKLKKKKRFFFLIASLSIILYYVTFVWLGSGLVVQKFAELFDCLKL